MALAGGLLFYHPPYVVLAPGGTIDVVEDIDLEGVPVDEVDGRFLATTVSIDRPTAFGAIVAALDDDREVLPVGEVVPKGTDIGSYFVTQRAVFEESQRVAAVAAARAVGLPAELTGTGATVRAVVPDAPAEDELEPGDTIVAVGGEPVSLVGDLGALMATRPVGTAVELRVERDEEERLVTVETARLPQLQGEAGLGVAVETRDADAELPFEVSFGDRPVGGPSARLAYALALADLLDDGDLAQGRTIAATGTIAVDGTVGPVGGVEQKALAAEADGASLFLVPAEEVEAAEGIDLDVREVEQLERALRSLRAAVA